MSFVIIPEMIEQTSKTFSQSIPCETIVKLFTDIKNDVKYVKEIEYIFDACRISDRIYCQKPGKSVSMSNLEVRMSYARCNQCSLCLPVQMKK